jgi:hypothetical protein
MEIRKALVAAGFSALCILGSSLSARATVFISNDRGGQIGAYIQNFSALSRAGERIVIDGPCLSACTMLLGIIPNDRICVTERAQLGFHAAWMPDQNGRPVTNAEATNILWEIYPQRVRRWIARRGGLSRKMIYLSGRELAAMYAPCRSTTAAR